MYYGYHIKRKDGKGRLYIGVCQNPKRRFQKHVYGSKNKYLAKDLNKDNKHKWGIYVIKEFEDKQLALIWEDKEILKYKYVAYNINRSGGNRTKEIMQEKSLNYRIKKINRTFRKIDGVNTI